MSERAADGTFKIDLAGRFKDMMGLKNGDIGTAVMGAGTAMFAGGVATNVVNYGMQATANALNNLQPLATGVVAGKARGIV